MSKPAGGASDTDSPQRPSMSTGWKWFFRIAGTAVMILFLTPALFVAKYYMADAGPEAGAVRQFGDPAGPHDRTQSAAIGQALRRHDPTNIPLQAAYARRAQDKAMRLFAVKQLSQSLTRPGAVWHPMESMIGKSALAEIAAHDSDPAVQAAARDGLLQVARGGAVVSR